MTSGRLRGKVALIGGARGIGEAISLKGKEVHTLME